MNIKRATKPGVSLQKYLEKKYKPVFERYKKLALALNDCDAFEVYEFRKGMKRMASYEISKIKSQASAFWGQLEVREAIIRSSAWNLLPDIKTVVKEENLRHRIKTLRETCGPDNPAPSDAPIEVLDLSDALKELFARKKITELRDIVGCTRERLAFFYDFTPETLNEIQAVINKVGRTFYK